MALIVSNRIDKVNKESNRIHKEVDATYTTFIVEGTKYIQIDTYGSDDREIRGKVSQSIQLDEKMLVELTSKLGANCTGK